MVSLRPTLSNSDSQYLSSAYYGNNPSLLSLSLVLSAIRVKKIFSLYFPSGFVCLLILFVICIIEIESKWIRNVFVHVNNYMLLVLLVHGSTA